MFSEATIKIGKSTIVINDKTFLLGELTADLLNIDRKFLELRSLTKEINKEVSNHYAPPLKKEWFLINEKLIKLDKELCKFKIFTALREDDYKLLEDTQDFTSQIGFTEEVVPEDLADTFEGFNPFAKSPAYWKFYTDTVAEYESYLDDIFAFNQTISFFINDFVSKANKLSGDTYAEMYYHFINHPSREKFIVGPLFGYGGCDATYRHTDSYNVSFVPMENTQGQFEIFDVLTINDLQSIIKLDFMKSIQAGHVIRRCEHCKKYFLLTKIYRTIYCDGMSPENHKFSCRQMGSMKKKETTENFPFASLKNKALDLLSKHLSRGNITKENFNLISMKINDIYSSSIRDHVSYENYQEMIKLDKIYKDNNIKKITKPRGRPKKDGDKLD
ncbi:MAG: DUF6076 domain-containing protein [Clostridia bacterium]